MTGIVVLNRFQIQHKLGSGGFGVVYRAWDTRLERHVAVKAIDAGGGGTGERVLREAQAAARLSHPGVVTLFEMGEENGQTYLVSELVEGATLRELARRGELCDREVGEVGADLCEALDHAHSRGVVHRDIKPQNIVVPQGDGPAKLMDFGIARVLDAEGLTAPGGVLGTLAYMAPEQAEGAEAGPEADVYSLAITLRECWTGQNPNLRATPAATARAIAGPVPSLARLRPDLPGPVVRALDGALDPDPRSRPDLEEVGEAIESCLDGLDGSRSVPPPRSHAGIAPVGDLAGREIGDLASAATAAGLVGAAMIATPGGDPLWAWLLPVATAALWLLRPRLGYLFGLGSLAAWLSLAAGSPGVSVLLVAVALPAGLLVSGTGRSLMLPAAAPLLGAVGLAPLFPVLAAMAARRRDRAVLAATGFLWIAAAELVLGRELLFGPGVDLPEGWRSSASAALTDALWPLLTQPAFVARAAIWSAAALLAGVLLVPVRAWLARQAVTTSRRLLPGRIGAPAAAAGGSGRPATLP
ncbi:MAG: serine/threonine-protein kinase [Solirubrobacterales bacterium]